MIRKILAALAVCVVATPVIAAAPKPAAAITYTVECVTTTGPPLKHGSGTSVTSASSACFRNIANSLYNSSCVSGVVITGNRTDRVGRTGIVYKGDASQGWPWYCGNGVLSKNVVSYIP